MASLSRAVEKSLTAHASDGNQARLREIQAASSMARRAGLLAIHTAASRFPQTVAHLFRLNYRPDLAYISEGAQSVVYRTENDTVVKIVKEKTADQQPTSYNPAERSQAAHHLRAEHASMAVFLGPVVLPHHIQVTSHPIEPQHEAIVITQPYRAIDFLHLSDDAEDTSDLRRQLGETRRTHPVVFGELRDMVEDSHRLFELEGLATDIVGPDNAGVCLQSRHLVIVDAQPVPVSRPEDQLLATYHLERLGAALQEVA